MILINTSFALVSIHIISTVIKPNNDPGLVIWWLCCTRYGHKGKFKTKILKENFIKFKENESRKLNSSSKKESENKESFMNKIK